MEWLVCYKVLYEETADETAVYFWPSPYDKVFYASLALHDHIGKTFKVFCRLFFFLFFLPAGTVLSTVSRCRARRYFIHSLSTLYYYNAPSLATRLTGDYRDRTFTGKCGPA